MGQQEQLAYRNGMRADDGQRADSQTAQARGRRLSRGRMSAAAPKRSSAPVTSARRLSELHVEPWSTKYTWKGVHRNYYTRARPVRLDGTYVCIAVVA